MAELLTSKASIDSNKRFLTVGWISNTIDVDMRTLKNLLNMIITSKINTNKICRFALRNIRTACTIDG